MTRTRLIVGLITHIVIYLTVMKPVREAKARLWASVPLMMMVMIQELNDALLSCQGYRVTSDTIAEAECLI
jgi:hypothetical protein